MKALFQWLGMLALAIPLIGAAESPYPPPVVVVYPMTAAGGTNADAGSQIAILLSNRLAQLGELTVKPYTPGTTRADYLNAAIKENADYYVTGYLTPVGGDVSFVAQVVSTYSGSIVYSSTQLVHTYGDAAGQAEPLRDAILHHAGRGLASLQAPPAQPTVSPTPNAGDAGINISRAFGRHKGSRPTSAPTVAAVAQAVPAVPPGTTALVVPTGGGGDDADRAYATTALTAALDRTQRSGVVALAAPDIVTHANDLCRLNPSLTTFYAPALSLERGRHGATSVAYDVTVYDCSAAPIGRQRISLPVGTSGVHPVIDRATAEALAGLRLPAGVRNAPGATPASPAATK